MLNFWNSSIYCSPDAKLLLKRSSVEFWLNTNHADVEWSNSFQLMWNPRLVLLWMDGLWEYFADTHLSLGIGWIWGGNLNLSCWSFCAFESPHHGNHVRTIAIDSLSDWSIKERIASITTDNGAEILCGMRLLGSDLNATGFHVRCFAHIINLAVRAAFGKIHSSIGNLQKLISAIRILVKRC